MSARPARIDADLLDRVRSWLADDPDPHTAAALNATLTAAVEGDPVAGDDLDHQFRGRLEFGTAGLRAPMGWGPRRMNRVTVGCAAAGLSSWLRAHDARSVVIGYDARHHSRVFATDTAAILAAAGLTARLLPRPLPTPVLVFAIGALDASAGVMVTASHNPAADNGYKVYVGRRPIVAPVDREIAALIDASGPLRDVSRADTWTTLDETVVQAYLARAAEQVEPAAPKDLTVVYTPVHGVAGPVLLAAFERAGFPAPRVVAAQAVPDPEFPTVTSPNPEDPETLSLALDLAATTHADLLLATDPDGDRCAVAVPDPGHPVQAGSVDVRWRVLTGDEVGDLLGEFLTGQVGPGAYATTIVSGSRLAAIAARHHRAFAQTLTGFKWLAGVPDLRYAYEEAIGYCVDPSAVPDKDGVTAALRVADLAARLRADGRTLLDALDDLDRTYGVHRTAQVTVAVAGDHRSRIAARLAALAAKPPTRLADRAVVHVDDLRVGSPDRPSTDGVRLSLEGRSPGSTVRVVVRASGTEPKIKAYLEVALPARPGGGDPPTLTADQRAASALLAALCTDVARLLA